jgi:hypothetical protein
MSVTFNPPDFSGFLADIKKQGEKLEELKGKEVSYSELFNSDFMKQYTNFSSFGELLEAGNFIVKTREDFRAIPDDEFDEHIAKTTKFKDWSEMKQQASYEYIKSNI